MKLEFNALRPCLILPNKRRGLCHGIFQDSYIVPPSLMVGGHSGGVVANPVAIVEVEDGQLIRVNPIEVKFVDNKFDEYDYREKENKNDQT